VTAASLRATHQVVADPHRAGTAARGLPTGARRLKMPPSPIRAWRYAPAVTAGEVLPDIAICRELASALRAGNDSAALYAMLATYARRGPNRVIGRLLPDGARPDGGSRHLQALGGMGILPRDLREACEALFPAGPVAPGSRPLFPERLLSQFAGQSSTVFETADGDDYRWCETKIQVGSAGKVWPLLTRPCLAQPRPPIMGADGYYAYLKSLPGLLDTYLAGRDRIRRGGPAGPTDQPRDHPARHDGFHGDREFRAAGG